MRHPAKRFHEHYCLGTLHPPNLWGGVFFAKLASNKPRGITHQLIHPPSQSTPRSGMLFILPEFGWPFSPDGRLAGGGIREIMFLFDLSRLGAGFAVPPPPPALLRNEIPMS